MDTDRLKYFCAVVELGSLSKASEIIGVSHSGLSKSLSLLQAELGEPLFRPHGRGLEITDVGKTFYPKAKEILSLMDQLMEPKKHQHTKPSRFALTEILAASCSGLIAQSFKQKLMIQQLEVGEIENQILNNQLDFAMSAALKPNPKLEYLSIGHLRFNSYARQDFYQKYKAEVPYAIPIHDYPTNLMGFKARDLWPVKVRRSIFYQVKSFAMAFDLLKSGQAAAFVPDFLAKKENKQSLKKENLVKVREHSEAQLDVEHFLIKPKAIDETRAMKKVASVVRKLCI